MFDQVMVDLETLDSAPTALIVAIGAIIMDFERLALGEEFYAVIDLEKPLLPGFTISPATVNWWMKQSEQARDIFNRPYGYTMLAALGQFRDFVLQCGLKATIWGNGATFDNMILRHAFEKCGLEYPVSYRNDLCYRTMRRMIPTNTNFDASEVAHNALDDARRQARCLLQMVGTLRGLNSTTSCDKPNPSAKS